MLPLTPVLKHKKQYFLQKTFSFLFIMLFVKFKFLSKIKLYLFISLSVTTNYFLKQYSGHLSDLDLHIIWTQETLLYLYLIFVLYHNGIAGFMKYILCTVHDNMYS